MIFQDPMTSLNPVLTIGDQIGEAIQVHNPAVKDDEAQPEGRRPARPRRQSRTRTSASTQYPHEFSGGMRQRAMIAMAIANEPSC